MSLQIGPPSGVLVLRAQVAEGPELKIGGREGGMICPEPDSNRHGVASEGFSYSLQLSLLSLATHLESGLSLCHCPVSCDTER
jgi:hypothetical protein